MNTTITATKPLTLKAQAEIERQENLTRLRDLLKPGATVYTVLRHKSASGMSRSISLIVLVKDETTGEPRPWDLTWLAAKVLGNAVDQHNGGLKTGGGGMDEGFALVYNLGRVLYPEGFGVEWFSHAKRVMRPTSKGGAAKLVEKGYTFCGRNGDKTGWDNDGGYALKHQWL